MIFSVAPAKHWPIASITKLMTAIVVSETLGLTERILISDNAISIEGIAGNLIVGEEYTVRDLLKAALVVSSNDAAKALEEFFNKTLPGENLVDAMNKKAAALGMTKTHFVDPIGLSVLNQSTAYDLEKLVGYILSKHEYILTMSGEKTAMITNIRTGTRKTLVNINSLVENPDFLGGKTGHIDEAKGNLISVFNIYKTPVLIVVLGSDDRIGVTTTLYEWLKKINYE